MKAVPLFAHKHWLTRDTRPRSVQLHKRITVPALLGVAPRLPDRADIVA